MNDKAIEIMARGMCNSYFSLNEPLRPKEKRLLTMARKAYSALAYHYTITEKTK